MTTTATQTPYADGSPHYPNTGLGQPVPLNGKDLFIAGITGSKGTIHPAQVTQWQTQHGGRNLGLVLDETILAIDVDHGYLNHHGRPKNGHDTLTTLERHLGTLPATITSTSRHTTHPHSRVHLYKVTPDVGRALNGNIDLEPQRPDDQFSDVEVIHHKYRYLAAWPSTHPDTGNTYHWYDREEQELELPPNVTELEDLPDAWVGYFLERVRTTNNGTDYGYASRHEINATLTDGDPHPTLTGIAVRFWRDDIRHGNGRDPLADDVLNLTGLLARGIARDQLPGGKAAHTLARKGFLQGQWDTPKYQSSFDAAFSRSLKFWIERRREDDQRAQVERDLHTMFTSSNPTTTTSATSQVPAHDPSTGEVHDTADDPAPADTTTPQAALPTTRDTVGPAPAPTREDGAALAAQEREEVEVLAEMSRQRVRDTARRRLAEDTATQVVLPTKVRLDQFLEEPDEDPTWRIQDVWPTGGTVLLTAPAKAGKSGLVGNVLRCLADSTPFLDRYQTNPARVVIIDDELDRRTLRRWLGEHDITNTEKIELFSLRGQVATFNILDPTVRAMWADQLRGNDVIVFDCLRPALDALGVSERDDAGRFLTALDALKLESEASEMLVVHHMGHDSDRARGDSRLIDWPDVAWKILPQDVGPLTDDSPRDFHPFGRDVDQPREQLVRDPVTRRLTLAGQASWVHQQAEAYAYVIATVTREPGVTTRALEQRGAADGYKRADVRKACEQALHRQVLYVEDGKRRSKTWWPYV